MREFRNGSLDDAYNVVVVFVVVGDAIVIVVQRPLDRYECLWRDLPKWINGISEKRKQSDQSTFIRNSDI